MESFFGRSAPSLYKVTFLHISSGKSQNIFLSLCVPSYLFDQSKQTLLNYRFVCSSRVLIPLGLPVALRMQFSGDPCGPASSSVSSAPSKQLWVREIAPSLPPCFPSTLSACSYQDSYLRPSAQVLFCTHVGRPCPHPHSVTNYGKIQAPMSGCFPKVGSVSVVSPSSV